MKTGFFAYSSSPHSCGDTIETAIKKINQSDEAMVTSWKELKTSGKFIISEVIGAINNSDFFCADMTGYNDNVLFETGFAIGVKKRVWLILDPSHQESEKKYKTGLLSAIGYAKYSSSDHIVSNFYKDEPYKGGETINELYKLLSVSENNTNIPLLMLKNTFDTDRNQAIIKAIKDYSIDNYVIDDASENKALSMSWYLSNLIQSDALIAEFTSIERNGFQAQNSKCSFLCGLAMGLGLRVLMVCEEPYETPLDYREFLKKHTTVQQCRDNIDLFLKRVKEDYEVLRQKKLQYRGNLKERTDLSYVDFGYYSAESESNNISNYYIPTSTVTELKNNDYNIVVGRKGSGKTATLYYMDHLLKRDARNLTCIIKPVSMELKGLLYLLSNVPDTFDKSYLIECTWKYVIYSEIANAVYVMINNKNVCTLSAQEIEYLKYIENNADIIQTDIFERMEANLNMLRAEHNDIDDKEFRVKVSEIMHTTIIADIRDRISEVIDKDIYILIDNLDKSWGKESEIEYQSEWLLGLLDLSQRINRVSFSSKKSKKVIRLRLTLFLRSDIFRYLLKNARERDKIFYSKLKVEDKDTLFHIIEERYEKLSPDHIKVDSIWDNYMPRYIKSIDIKSYIYNIIIPRPRDIIYLFTKIRENALQRGHKRFMEDDVIAAYEEYSLWVFDSLLTENGLTVKQMEDFLYDFAGEKSIVSLDLIVKKAKKATIQIDDPKSQVAFIDHLVRLSIIGREIKHNEFKYNYDDDDDRVSRSLAEKLNTNRYRIHNALFPYLEINDKDNDQKEDN